MTPTIVLLIELKRHLRYTATNPDQDLELQQKLDAATSHILRYCGNDNAYWQPIVDTWIDAASTPEEVRSAILLQAGELDRFRGDDNESDHVVRDLAYGDLQPAIVSLLRRYRDPVFA